MRHYGIFSNVSYKIIGTFPEFLSAAKELPNAYIGFLNNVLETNRESVMLYYYACMQELTTIQKELGREGAMLTFEQRMKKRIM